MHTVKHASLGTLVVGSRKQPPPGSHPGASLKRALKTAAATISPPASVSYAQAAAACLALIYLNNALGCCVIAWGYHFLGTVTGNADGGQPFEATDAQITTDYSAIGGYIPGNSATDDGCDEVTAFQYWMAHGFADGSELTGYASVDITDDNEANVALDAFENVSFAACLPNEWVQNLGSLSSSTIWDVAGDPNPNNGHAFGAVAYDGTYFYIVTWGMIIRLTRAAAKKYCVPSAGGAAYALLSPEIVAKGQAEAPNKLDWPTLIAELMLIPGADIGTAAPVPADPSAPVVAQSTLSPHRSPPPGTRPAPTPRSTPVLGAPTKIRR